MFEVGSDGMTAYERIRGKKYRRELPIFGERIYYLPMDRNRGRANKLSEKWLLGVYLGLKLGSNEVCIGTPTGVVRAAAVKRRASDKRFVWAELEAVVGTPRRPTPSIQDEDQDESPGARYPIAPARNEPAL